MFPPHDLRATDLPEYDSRITESDFWRLAERTLRLHTHFAVKNSKESGILQAASNQTTRWFIGWLADPAKLEATLERMRLLWLQTAVERSFGLARMPSSAAAEWVVLPPSEAGMPRGWSVYNPSIARLSRSAWLTLCAGWSRPQQEAVRGPNDDLEMMWRSGARERRAATTERDVRRRCHDAFGSHVDGGDGGEPAVAISWFGRAPGTSMGCVSYLGVAHPQVLSELLRGSSHSSRTWLLAPRMLHDVLGPKLADPRLFSVTTHANAAASSLSSHSKGDALGLSPPPEIPAAEDDANAYAHAPTESLALVGYARLGPHSAAWPAMADYHVRASLVAARPSRQRGCSRSPSNHHGSGAAERAGLQSRARERACDFSSGGRGREDGQCFTASARFVCCAQDQALASLDVDDVSAPRSGAEGPSSAAADSLGSAGGEVYLPCGGAHCGSVVAATGARVEQSGIEVPLHPSSTATGANVTHMPAKNVMPVLGVRGLPPAVALFVDFAPREKEAERAPSEEVGRGAEQAERASRGGTAPLMVATDMQSGVALRRWTLNLTLPCSSLAGSGTWRGSTQVVPLHEARAAGTWNGAPRCVRGVKVGSAAWDEQIWVSLVHSSRGRNRSYRSNFSLVVLAGSRASVPWASDGTPHDPPEASVLLPTTCVAMMPLPLPSSRRLNATPTFAFAAGLAPWGWGARSDDRSFAYRHREANPPPNGWSDEVEGTRWRLLVSWGLEDQLPAISELVLAA